MTITLNNLNENDIRSRCTESSFERGEAYYARQTVKQRIHLTDKLQTRVSGTYTYTVIIEENKNGLQPYCTCPYDWGGDCKHIVATLLAWLNEPDSFQDPVDLKAVLSKYNKTHLIEILSNICTVYPHLIAEFGLTDNQTTYNPEAVVSAIFNEFEPPSQISRDEAVTRMENIHKQAKRLLQNNQTTLARQTYYYLTLYCKDFCERYGSTDIFPEYIPAKFTEAYIEIALLQLADHTKTIAITIANEVKAMISGDVAAEILGIEDILEPILEILGL